MSNVISKQQRNMRRANAARKAMVMEEMSKDRVPRHSHQTGLDCDDDDYGRYPTYAEAQAACSEDIKCAAIYDGNCDNDHFRLCPTDYTEKESVNGSCLYIKTGKEIEGIF